MGVAAEVAAVEVAAVAVAEVAAVAAVAEVARWWRQAGWRHAHAGILRRLVQSRWRNGERAFVGLGHILRQLLRGWGCCPQDDPDKNKAQGNASSFASGWPLHEQPGDAAMVRPRAPMTMSTMPRDCMG